MTSSSTPAPTNGPPPSAPSRAPRVVVGDLADASAVHRIADQANSYGPFDAIVHNAGLYIDHARVATVDGHARVLAVNVLAPYMLTVLIQRPERFIYLSSGIHHDAHRSLDDGG